MRISKDQYRSLTTAHGEAEHIATLLDDLREGTGHPTDLDKVRKSMVRLNAYVGQSEVMLMPRRTIPKEDPEKTSAL